MITQWTQFIPTPKNWQQLKPHPLAQFTEFGAGIDISGLSAHMRRNGFDQDESIILISENKQMFILDGRHKHLAAQDADVTPTRFPNTERKNCKRRY